VIFKPELIQDYISVVALACFGGFVFLMHEKDKIRLTARDFAARLGGSAFVGLMVMFLARAAFELYGDWLGFVSGIIGCGGIEMIYRLRKPAGAAVGIDLSDTIKREEAKPKKQSPMVLAVDDDQVQLAAIRKSLQDHCTVHCISEPEKVKKFLQTRTPDLFLLDNVMRGMTGLELIPILRSFPEHETTPIIMLTSDESADTLTSALALGVSDYVLKPFRIGALREKVMKTIELSRGEL
jgi:PleD family two-component response regulator